MTTKGQKVVIEFFVLELTFEFEAVLRLCGVEKGLVEHLKYKLQIAKYKIQNTKYKVLWLCGGEKGGGNATNGFHGKNDPIDNLVEHLKYKIQRARQWTKHTYRLHQKRRLILYLGSFVFVFVSLCSVLYCIS